MNRLIRTLACLATLIKMSWVATFLFFLLENFHPGVASIVIIIENVLENKLIGGWKAGYKRLG